jgi:hypothetical protein
MSCAGNRRETCFFLGQGPFSWSQKVANICSKKYVKMLQTAFVHVQKLLLLIIMQNKKKLLLKVFYLYS